MGYAVDNWLAYLQGGDRQEARSPPEQPESDLTASARLLASDASVQSVQVSQASGTKQLGYASSRIWEPEEVPEQVTISGSEDSREPPKYIPAKH